LHSIYLFIFIIYSVLDIRLRQNPMDRVQNWHSGGWKSELLVQNRSDFPKVVGLSDFRLGPIGGSRPAQPTHRIWDEMLRQKSFRTDVGPRA